MDGFIESGPGSVGLLRSDGGAGQHADGAGEDGAFVGEDVAEHVFGNHDVEALRIQNKLHGGVIDQKVVQFDVRVIFRHFDNDSAPELRGFEDVGFIDRGELFAAFAGEFEAHAGDAFDFAPGVGHGVDGAGLGTVFIDAAGRAVVDTGVEFTDDNHVYAVNKMVLERRGFEQRGVAANGTEVRVDTHGLADAEETTFRALFRRPVIEFREANRAHEDGVGFDTEFRGFFGERRTGLVDGDAAEEGFADLEIVAPFFGDGAQDTDGFPGDFGSDTVTGEDEDVEIQNYRLLKFVGRSLTVAARYFFAVRQL